MGKQYSSTGIEITTKIIEKKPFPFTGRLLYNNTTEDKQTDLLRKPIDIIVPPFVGTKVPPVPLFFHRILKSLRSCLQKGAEALRITGPLVVAKNFKGYSTVGL
jgi:hypothetical protein